MTTYLSGPPGYHHTKYISHPGGGGGRTYTGENEPPPSTRPCACLDCEKPPGKKDPDAESTTPGGYHGEEHHHNNHRDHHRNARHHNHHHHSPREHSPREHRGSPPPLRERSPRGGEHSPREHRVIREERREERPVHRGVSPSPRVENGERGSPPGYVRVEYSNSDVTERDTPPGYFVHENEAPSPQPPTTHNDNGGGHAGEEINGPMSELGEDINGPISELGEDINEPISELVGRDTPEYTNDRESRILDFIKRENVEDKMEEEEDILEEEEEEEEEDLGDLGGLEDLEGGGSPPPLDLEEALLEKDESFD